MVTAIIPFAMAAIGGVIYFVASNPKLAEIGRMVCFAGLLALALMFSSSRITL